MTYRTWLLGSIVAGLLAAGAPSGAAEPAAPAAEPNSPWTNSTELSLVLTHGNSSVETIGFKDTLEYKTAKGRSRLRLDTLLSNTSDDPYLLVEPGITFEPGEQPTGFTTSGVRPPADPDVQRYFAEGRYEGTLPRHRSWNVGASWDRNEDAGILNRTILFAGYGNIWKDTTDLTFRSSYGLSYTDREEEVPDPEKERRFPGARLTLDLMVKFGKSTTYDNDLTFNDNLQDVSDYTVDFLQGLSVSMSKRLSLKISLQLTYSTEPAQEDVDVILRAILIDPDGIPGNGDEFFQTVDSGGFDVTIGEDQLRKETLDTTFRSSLMITF